MVSTLSHYLISLFYITLISLRILNALPVYMISVKETAKMRPDNATLKSSKISRIIYSKLFIEKLCFFSKLNKFPRATRYLNISLIEIKAILRKRKSQTKLKY